MNEQHFKEAVKFGRDLIRTQDLDPVYTAMVGAGMPKAQLAKTFLAYTCLYHLGASVAVAEGCVPRRREQPDGTKEVEGTTVLDRTDTGFYCALQHAALNEGLWWPRGSERRHWRGKNALRTVDYLVNRSMVDREPKPLALVTFWAAGKTFNEVARRVRMLPSYGPWIAFKVADMLERVMGMPVDFSDCALGVYEEPRRSAALLLTGDAAEPISNEQLDAVIRQLLKALGPMKAPPNGSRRINVQEAETVLCKYKSHVNGHYPLGKDTREVLHGLRDPKWACATTKKMAAVIERLPYAKDELPAQAGRQVLRSLVTRKGEV